MATQLLPFVHVLIFLLSLIKVSVASDAVKWTTSPEDSDYLVGSDAILRWDYSTHPSNKIRFIKFGIKVRADEDVTIIRNDVLTKIVIFNNKEESDREVTAPFDGRLSMLKNETASFKITKLAMSDTGTYFCYLEPEDRIEGVPSYDEVKIRVVDIIIDRKNSTVHIESWEGHKITMKCVVRKAFINSTVRFYWSKSNGQQLTGREVYFKDRELSQKTIVTDTDAQFNSVRCTAKTETSTQTLDITIKRLHKPTEPMNVTVQEIRGNNTECHVRNKLIWEPPVDDGDTPIISYIVEYKHPVFRDRILISETVNDCREHVTCKLQASGYPREVHVDVRAINKVGRGFRSPPVRVSFFSSPSAPLHLTKSLDRKQQPPFNVRVSWSPPEENGGSPVLQYQLEYKEKGSPWIDATILSTNNTYILINKTEKAYIYEVRVTAKNKFGLGASSEVVTAAFAEKPDRPQRLVKGKVFYDQQNRPNIKVVWKPPNYDGGSAISHYVVEHKTVKTEWSSAANETVKKTEYSLQVKQSETYTVRVTAVNRMGVGEAAVLTVKFTDEDAKNLARSNKSTASMTSSGSLGMLLLLSALSYALA